MTYQLTNTKDDLDTFRALFLGLGSAPHSIFTEAHNGGKVEIKELEVYWDGQEAGNEGWAYRTPWDSGSVTSLEQFVHLAVIAIIADPECLDPDRVSRLRSEAATAGDLAMVEDIDNMENDLEAGQRVAETLAVVASETVLDT